MTVGALYGITWLAILLIGSWRLKRRRLGLGSAATGMMSEILSQDRRHAIEIIVKNEAEARDPEDADGNLPDLESPRQP